MATTKTQKRIQRKASAQLPLVQRQTRRLSAVGQFNPFAKYQTFPLGYAQTELGITPWPGRNAKGQRELYEDIAASVTKQLAGEVAPRVFRVESGNGLGKTYGVAPLVNWFFDAFVPSIVYTTAPSKEQVELLLWKYIKAQRPEKLPGRVLPKEPRMEKSADHFALGKTTSDAGGKGEERFKGQHHPYLMFVLDEAEGVPKFVYDAILRMMTGGLVIIVILLGNPRSRSSEFFKWGRRPGVLNYRWSALDHPNVLDGKETVPGATNRDWVIGRIWEWCEVVDEDNPDNYTFTIPFDVPPPPEGEGASGAAGTIFLPNSEFLTSVLGIAPANLADNTLIPSGRYEAATVRVLTEETLSHIARIGVDVAGFGKDAGTIYIRRGRRVWRAAQVFKLDQVEYAQRLKKEALKLLADGVTDLQIRIDAGGGFAGGVIAILERDEELKPKPKARPQARGVVQPLGGNMQSLGTNHQSLGIRLPVRPSATVPAAPPAAFERFDVVDVHFNGVPYDTSAYADLATEMMAEAAESLKGLCLVNPPATLEADLTERKYDWINIRSVWVKKLESKKEFRKPNRLGRSPDDGDGFVLCVAPDFMFPLDDNGFS